MKIKKKLDLVDDDDDEFDDDEETEDKEENDTPPAEWALSYTNKIEYNAC
jgi:hypothetical protein